MTTTSPTNTADAINHLVDKASSGLDQITHAMSQHAPQAWMLVVKGAYAAGVASLIVGAVSATLLVIFASVCIALAFAANRNFEREDEGFVGGMCVGGSVICFIVAAGCFIGVCLNLGSSDSWSRVISPDGYVAQEILSGALNR